MAEYSIIARSVIQARGATAFKRGKARDAHDMNPGAAAIADFYIGYDAEAKTHSATATAGRVDAVQASPC